MSPTGQAIRSAVEGAVRRVRRDGVLASALAVAAIAPAALLVALAWGPGGRIARGAGPLVFLALAAVVAGALAVWLGWRWVRSVDEAGVAAAAERRGGLAEGSLRGLLELGRQVSPGGSDALVRHSEAELAGRLSGARAADLAGDVGEHARRRRWRLAGVAGALTGITILAAFGAPERARGAWAPLLSPVAMLSAPSLPPLVVRPGHAEIPRGQPLDVLVEAPYRDGVVVRWRATGDVPRSRALRLAAGRGSLTLGAVNAPLVYWVEAPDGAVSDSFRVRPVDPLLVRGLTVEVVYPAHVGRETERYAGEAPPLRVPEGTRIRAWGGATRPLRAIALVRGDGVEIDGAVRASGFSIDWRPRVEDSGLWEWRLSGAGASPEATPPAPLDVTVVRDMPPAVRITLPGPDAPMPASFRQQVVADASDDYGVVAAALLFRRVTAAGERGPERTAPLRVEPGADRLLIRTVLDASDEALVPGDAIHYRVVVRDNSPAGQAASSAEHVLRLPSMAELRDRAREESGRALEEAERVAERTRDLQSATRDLSRQAAGRSAERRGGSEAGRPSQSSQLGFEEASEARQVLDGQEALLDEVAALEQRMAELQRAVEEAGLRDPDLQRRLEELRAMYDELARPEMAADLERLREAVDALDPEAVREALERLAAQQEELRQRMEESLELMRRAAVEQEMGTLAREAEELSAQQRALADAMREELPPGEPPSPEDSARAPSPPPSGATPPEPGEPGEPGESGEREEPRDGGDPSSQSQGAEQRAEQQEEMGEQAQRLNESMQQLQQQLMQIGEREAAQSTGSAQQKGQSAQQSMEEAAEQARDQQGSQASESGARAASQMGQAAAQLESARQSMTEGWEREVREAVQQATQDALSLAQREEALRRQMEQAQQQGSGEGQGQMMQQMRSEQAALQQGLQQLGRNLSEAGQQSGMVNRDVSRSLARAMLNMEQTLRAMQQQGQMPVQQAGQTVESLNQLAMSLLQNEGQMQQQAGDPMQQALEQLSQLAQEQGSVNGQTGALAPMELGRQAMTQQLQQLAQQQRGIARRVGSVSEMMGGRENVLGRLDQLSSEAELIAEELEGGRLDPDVRARQERLFNRLLDAGRSLEREEYSDERVGESGAGVEASSPEALDPALLDPLLRYPAPTADRLRTLPPAYRRLILEYFDRLNRGGGGEAGAAAGGGGGSP